MKHKTNPIKFQKFDTIFPQVTKIELDTRKKTIALAHKVARALKMERETLAKEEQEYTTASRLLSASS